MNLKYFMIFLVFAGFFTIFLFGCSQQKIDVHWESRVDKVMDSSHKLSKPKVQDSRGMLIYRAGQKPAQSQEQSTPFGPSFDLPMKF